MTKYGIESTIVKVKSAHEDDDDAPRPGESTPLLSGTTDATTSTEPRTASLERMQMFQSFRRRSPQKLSHRGLSQTQLITTPSFDDGGAAAANQEDKLVHQQDASIATLIAKTGSIRNGILATVSVKDLDLHQELASAQPIEGLAPLFPRGGIQQYDDRGYIPYREASLVKSVPAFPPYRRTARHRSFYLWWTNEFRHWWKSSRLLVRLGGLYVYHFDPIKAPYILLLDPTKHKSIKKYFKFAKRLGQGGDQMRVFVKTVKPFTRSMRLLVGTWRWVEAAPCRRGEVGVEEFMAFVGNRVSRMFARSATDAIAYNAIFPFQRLLFRQDLLSFPSEYHPIALCVCIGVVRAISPFAASFQGSRLGRVLTRRFFASERNRWLPVQGIESLNLMSDDCQEKDEVNQTSDLVIIARVVAKALGVVQVSKDFKDGESGVVRQHEALLREGFQQVGAGSGGYAVYQYHFYFSEDSPVKSTTILLHVTPYGPSITDVMPYYTVLEFETSRDRRGQWSEFVAKSIWQGPPVLEGYCYQGAFFSPHQFAELKEMYDKQLLAYETSCKKLPIMAKTHRTGVPRDLPTLKKFLEAGKRTRKRKKNIGEFNELQRIVRSVAKEITSMIKEEKRKRGKGEECYVPKGVILYFEGLDCSGKSSTGGLVQAALEQAGYQVEMRQYNRPPTAEQRARPWMDRFEIPGESSILDLTPNTTDGEKNDDDMRLGLVWDRGPGGDFVYGNLNDLLPHEKQQHYQEFIEFDKKCREKDILFLKLLFVTNRDSIAKTLGKRLAQKKMARDLKTWLRACSSRGESDDVPLEGLDAIEAHIDPTDFVAFNNYERNLRIFSNFALNTDSKSNPWVVVNTGDRYAARKALMQTFRVHLEEFRARGKGLSVCCAPKPLPPAETPGLEMDTMMKAEFKRSWRHSLYAWLTLMGLLLLAFIYTENTKWTDTWFRRPTQYNITELLEGGDDDMMMPVKTAKTSKADKEVPGVGDKNDVVSKASKETKLPEANPSDSIVKKAKTEKIPQEDVNMPEVGPADSGAKKAKTEKVPNEDGNTDMQDAVRVPLEGDVPVSAIGVIKP